MRDDVVQLLNRPSLDEGRSEEQVETRINQDLVWTYVCLAEKKTKLWKQNSIDR